MKGLNEEKLISLCDEKDARRGVWPWVYWTSELYSFGRHIRKYGFYPNFLPLAVYSDHSGPALDDKIYPHELDANAPIFLTHSRCRCENYKKLTGRKSYVMFSPAVFYRRKNKIAKLNGAKGTIAFPVHTLPGYEEYFDAEKYIEQLKNAPS